METQDTTIEEQDTTVEEPENIPLFKPGAWLIMATRKLRKHPMLPKANTDMIRLGLGAIILGPEPEAKAKEAGANYDIRGFVKDPNSKTFQCVMCDRDYESLQSMLRHMKKHTGAASKCPYCSQPDGQWWTVPFELTRHIMTRHKDEDRKALPVVMAIYNLYTDRWEEADKWLNHKTRSDRGDPVRPQVHRKRTETLKAQIIQRRREEELNDLQLAATTPLQQGINTNNSSWQAPLVNHPNVLNSVTNETPQAANVPKTPRETYVDETGYIRRVGSGSHPQILGQGTNTNNFQWQANLVDDPNLLNSVPNETPQAANVPKKPKETYVDETGYIRRVGSGSHQQIFGQGITTNNLQWQATSVDDPNMLNSVPNETPQAANVPKKPKETYVDDTGYIRRIGSGSHQQILGQGKSSVTPNGGQPYRPQQGQRSQGSRVNSQGNLDGLIDYNHDLSQYSKSKQKNGQGDVGLTKQVQPLAGVNLAQSFYDLQNAVTLQGQENRPHNPQSQENEARAPETQYQDQLYGDQRFDQTFGSHLDEDQGQLDTSEPFFYENDPFLGPENFEEWYMPEERCQTQSTIESERLVQPSAGNSPVPPGTLHHTPQQGKSQHTSASGQGQSQPSVLHNSYPKNGSSILLSHEQLPVSFPTTSVPPQGNNNTTHTGNFVQESGESNQSFGTATPGTGILHEVSFVDQPQQNRQAQLLREQKYVRETQTSRYDPTGRGQVTHADMNALGAGNAVGTGEQQANLAGRARGNPRGRPRGRGSGRGRPRSRP